jgi:hypothetical protein|tara:strand:- start:7078 stop:7305 length:228 start_codon:yes stop_codon:yes gene_type:complete
MINALRKKYEAEIAAAKANIDVYQKNPAGIGEHPDLVSAVDSEMSKLATARDKLETLNTYYSDDNDQVLLAENEE